MSNYCYDLDLSWRKFWINILFSLFCVLVPCSFSFFWLDFLSNTANLLRLPFKIMSTATEETNRIPACLYKLYRMLDVVMEVEL